MAEVVHPQGLHLLGPLHLVLHRHEVAHDPGAVPSGRLDGLQHRGVVGYDHNRNDLGPRLGGDFHLEGPCVHGLEVGHDELVRKGPLEFSHDLHPFALDEGRARLKPVSTPLHGLLGGLEGSLLVHEIQGHLQNRPVQHAAFHEVGGNKALFATWLCRRGPSPAPLSRQ